MLHLGFLTFSVPGHLNPSLTLAAALSDLGHRVTFFSLPDGIEKIEQAGYRAECYGGEQFSAEDVSGWLRQLGEMSGIRAVRFTVEMLRRQGEVALRDLPDRLSSQHLDGLVIDQIFPAAAVLAQASDLPYVSLSNALPLDRDPTIPPIFSHAGPAQGIWGRWGNRSLYRLADWLSRPIVQQVKEYQVARRLPPARTGLDLVSDLAHIIQIPACFDFPREPMVRPWHFVGPLHSRQTRAATDFPWDQIDETRPLIYASLGTLQNRLRHVFEIIAAACAELPVQLVMSLGGSADPEEYPPWPGDPIVVRFAPQLELLQRARICVTHAGLNTTLESLARGVPMLAIPVTGDQPGVAARIVYHGVGSRLRLRKVTVRRVQREIKMLLDQPGYAQRAAAMQAAIGQCGGATEAARIIEQVIRTRQPVLPARG